MITKVAFHTMSAVTSEMDFLKFNEPILSIIAKKRKSAEGNSEIIPHFVITDDIINGYIVVEIWK